MARYIDADALLKELDLRETDTTIQLKQGDEKHRLCQKGILSGLNWSRNIIYETPEADVVEVKHGEWLLERKPDGTPYIFHCSVCDSDFSHIGHKSATDYCPDCGVIMDGGKKE